MKTSQNRSGNNTATPPEAGSNCIGFRNIAAWRQKHALRAAYEIEGLSVLLKRIALDEEDCIQFAVHGMSARLQELAGIVMSAVGDDQETEESIALRLYGLSSQKWKLAHESGAQQ